MGLLGGLATNGILGGGSVSSPVNLVTVAASPVLANKLLVGDANPAFQIKGDGTLGWGAGGASGQDVTLFRQGASALQCSGYMLASNQVRAPFGGSALVIMGDSGPAAESGISFQNSEIHLYRAAANVLAFDATLRNMVTANEVTAATAGTNGAVPAQVKGYLIAQDHTGTTIKIPYFAN